MFAEINFLDNYTVSFSFAMIEQSMMQKKNMSNKIPTNTTKCIITIDNVDNQRLILKGITCHICNRRLTKCFRIGKISEITFRAHHIESFVEFIFGNSLNRKFRFGCIIGNSLEKKN